jgi:hypothetical protein
MYKKGDLIHYKENKFEGLLKVIINDFGGDDNQYTIIFFACNDKHWAINEELAFTTEIGKWTLIRARDLALYTHWPVHTKEFWELLRTE